MPYADERRQERNETKYGIYNYWGRSSKMKYQRKKNKEIINKRKSGKLNNEIRFNEEWI